MMNNQPDKFQGKCKRDPYGRLYYLQLCSVQERNSGSCGSPVFDGTDWEDDMGDYVTAEGSTDPNLPRSHKRLYSLVLDCTNEEIANGFCDNVPEPGQRLNPCMTAQVMVEVSNNGQTHGAQ